MLEAALDILDGEGADALTMRALAKRSGVNPMTLYHHFGDQDGLIKALSERVYAGVVSSAGWQRSNAAYAGSCSHIRRRSCSIRG